MPGIPGYNNSGWSVGIDGSGIQLNTGASNYPDYDYIPPPQQSSPGGFPWWLLIVAAVIWYITKKK